MRAEGTVSRGRAILIAALFLGVTALAMLVPLGNALVVSQPVAAPDAIVSLGSHEWERLPVAARLARANPHAVVLLTQPVWATDKNCHRCQERVNWLVRAGVAPTRIFVLASRVRNTRDEAAAAFSYAATRGVRSMMIVTSPYHGRRALAVFRSTFSGSPVRIGIEVATAESQARPSSWWMHSYDRWYVAYESAALLMYLVRYGVNPIVV